MSNLQNLCRNCGRDLGRDQQSLALGACSGTCARAISIGLARCGDQFRDGGMRSVCSLPPKHSGSHKTPMGFEWASHAVRPLSSMAPSAEKGGYLSSEDIAKLAGEGGTETKRICACCPKPVNTSNPHAVFCSSMCAEKAAEAYMSRPRTTVINTPPQMFVAAERALGFIAGLNLQDHSVKEQRESLDVVRALQTALRPERVKFEGTMGRLRDEEARQKSVREEKDREKKARFLQNLTKPICFGTK